MVFSNRSELYPLWRLCKTISTSSQSITIYPPFLIISPVSPSIPIYFPFFNFSPCLLITNSIISKRLISSYSSSHSFTPASTHSTSHHSSSLLSYIFGSATAIISNLKILNIFITSILFSSLFIPPTFHVPRRFKQFYRKILDR